MPQPLPTTGQTFDVAGMRELQDALKKLSEKGQRRALLGAAKTAWEPIVRTAKSLAPVRSGGLRDAIEVWAQTDKRSKKFGHAVTVEAGLKKSSSKARAAVGQAADYYGRWGRKSTEKGAALKGGIYYAPWVEHGTKDFAARPFLGPAFDANAEQAIDIFAGRMWTLIRKEVDRAAKIK